MMHVMMHGESSELRTRNHDLQVLGHVGCRDEPLITKFEFRTLARPLVPHNHPSVVLRGKGGGGTMYSACYNGPCELPQYDRRVLSGNYGAILNDAVLLNGKSRGLRCSQ